ncbi:hypothetical protein AB0G15_05820 [Streptosporangium sp. NPDC023825]|uniref:hypothetical protein n=1 Tax=Streptosporangium sp. NPDC023825 TaxID=3154909 RepID=UPI0034220251
MTIKHVRMTQSANRRRQLMARTTDYVVRVEEDRNYPRDYIGYSEDDLAKYFAGKYRAWVMTVYRTCPDHVGMEECADYEVVESASIGIVLTEMDLTGDYTSPYFIDDEYARWQAWDMWQCIPTREPADA